jgi:hypothetical protein
MVGTMSPLEGNPSRAGRSQYSQQASEKALKSLLIFLGRDPGKTHSLTELADIIEKEGLEVPSNVKENLTFSGVKGAKVPLRE